MTSKNDITGDKIRTKGVYSKEGEDRFDAIFRKKKEPVQLELDFDEDRIDIIGQNGPTGDHYEEK
jgi:hypothetical protein